LGSFCLYRNPLLSQPLYLGNFSFEIYSYHCSKFHFLKSQNRFLLPALGWLILCTVLFTLPASAFPSEKWYTKIPMFDKWVHIGLISILSFLFCWGLYKGKNSSEKNKRNFILTGIICLCYGIMIEFIQRYFIPNRSFDIGDIIADGVGSLTGVIFSLKRYIKK
jgi:VanZ family protein